ncbi:pectinesterase inhibitor 5 [Quercus suber]|uniref:Pectinesterase inhibitor 5 n=1 Tax=Quercus suber TaxID=58331 RepID=A0AAW0M032_QUESU|nr:cell wall / vacuolar inhibitor of fructosidase 2-like [Quercus suber]POF04742.1 hypothetical protein CFP56_60947 [Quercus suber]
MVSPISCLSILVIPLLVTSLFYQVSNACVNATYRDRICKQSTYYDLCTDTFASDNRTSTADLSGLLLISISSNMNLLENTTVHRIPGILKMLNDTQDKARLQNCQTDFIYALGKLSAAYLATGSKNYREGKNLTTDAYLKVLECEKEYNSTNFASPIADVPEKSTGLYFIGYTILRWLRYT